MNVLSRWVWLLGLLWLLVACQTEEIPPMMRDTPTEVMVASLTAVTQAQQTTPPQNRVAQMQALNNGQPLPAPVLPTGDTQSFWFTNLATAQKEAVTAQLIYQNEAVAMWVADGVRLDLADAQQAADQLATVYFPQVRTFFGSENQPGIDNDARIHILHLPDITGALGYFSGADTVSTAVNPFSNQREMLYLNNGDAPVGSEAYYSTIVHEFQHIIHHHQDQNEDAWLNEGLSELALHLAGFDLGRESDYVNQTDIQLTTLNQQQDVVGAHYASASLFTIYLYDRLGAEAIQQLTLSDLNGFASIEQIANQYNSNFDALFADWLVANYLNSHDKQAAPYAYAQINLPRISPTRLADSGQGAVHQYGADYYRLTGTAPVTLAFTGSQQTPLVSAEPSEGDTMWLSSPADESHQTLTGAFSRTNAEATLTFDLWYEIEEGWDYGYVSFSSDNGRSWQHLTTQHSTTSNPHGNNLGVGYTGSSEGWQTETAVLPTNATNFQLRFEYITDGAVHLQGMAIDNIRLTGVEETSADIWQADGFADTHHILPQTFMVQAILLNDATFELMPLPLEADQTGEWLLPLGNQWQEVIIIVAGNTPITSYKASYEWQVIE